MTHSPTVTLHGKVWNLVDLDIAILFCRQFDWEKKVLEDKEVSAYCEICCWELKQSENIEHSTGYFNGQDWVCSECYENLIKK